MTAGNWIGSASSLLFFLLVACVSSDAASDLPMRVVAKGAFSGIFDARQEVIQDRSKWEPFWAQHAARNQPPPPAPKIDFTTEMVIAVTMGRQRTGGYSIEIQKVEPEAKRLKILVQKKSPPPGAITIQALTAPFHFVAVPKNNLKPHFVETGQARRPSPEKPAAK